MKTTRLRKLECPVCGLILRGSRGPITERVAEHGRMPVCMCGVPMIWGDAEDAYACLDGHELYSHPAVQELEGATDRRLAREASKRGRGKSSSVGQCGGCRKPITATNEHCSQCGFANDLRGRRNHGGYREGMPF